MMELKGALTISREKEWTRSVHNLFGKKPFLKLFAPLESYEWELSNGAKNVKNGFLSKKLCADRADSFSREIVSAPLSALIFTCLLSREGYYFESSRRALSNDTNGDFWFDTANELWPLVENTPRPGAASDPRGEENNRGGKIIK